MVIAALLCFGILLVAWVVAPDRPRAVAPQPPAPDSELTPVLEPA